LDRCNHKDKRLQQQLWGLNFKNPLGMAPGFDKNAEVPNELINLGFGFVEVGTITPKPQEGNPKPRIFRLIKDQGVINRLGFNNEGHDAALLRLQGRNMSGVIGVNIGANKESNNRVGDYLKGFQTFQGVADYFTINISSPNTPGLRDLQSPEALDELLGSLMQARTNIIDHGGKMRPIFVKLAPDIDDQDLEPIIYKLLDHKVDAVIISNTTLSRTGLTDPSKNEAGGLSGRPLFKKSTRMLARVHLISEGALPIIGVGGIENAETAWQKLEAGANLIQLYSGMIYKGPSIINSILKGLSQRLDQEQLHSLASIRGRTADDWANLKID
jgi:dihydroorotate dehydrogenase